MSTQEDTRPSDVSVSKMISVGAIETDGNIDGAADGMEDGWLLGCTEGTALTEGMLDGS